MDIYVHIICSAYIQPCMCIYTFVIHVTCTCTYKSAPVDACLRFNVPISYLGTTINMYVHPVYVQRNERAVLESVMCSPSLSPRLSEIITTMTSPGFDQNVKKKIKASCEVTISLRGPWLGEGESQKPSEHFVPSLLQTNSPVLNSDLVVVFCCFSTQKTPTSTSTSKFPFILW